MRMSNAFNNTKFFEAPIRKQNWNPMCVGVPSESNFR